MMVNSILDDVNAIDNKRIELGDIDDLHLERNRIVWGDLLVDGRGIAKSAHGLPVWATERILTVFCNQWRRAGILYIIIHERSI